MLRSIFNCTLCMHNKPIGVYPGAMTFAVNDGFALKGLNAFKQGRGRYNAVRRQFSHHRVKQRTIV